MSGVWFTSDLHFGHRLVAELRGFRGDTEAHDETLIANWCDRIQPDGQVWVLGDLAVSAPGYALNIIGDLPGRKHLIAGNHDYCHPMHRDAHKKLPAYLDVFESVQAFARRRIAGRSVLLSHFPYSADRGETRYAQYRLPDLGEFLLHGHTHSSERVTSERELHVGVDAWDLAPVPLATVESFVIERRGTS